MKFSFSPTHSCVLGSPFRLIFSLTMCVLISLVAVPANAQFEEIGRAIRAVQGASKKKGDSEDKDKKEEEEAVEVPDIPAEPIPPKLVRFHMSDGSIISGDLAIEFITVKTDFGELKVPIKKIVAFRPGLKSFPERVSKIEQLVDQLGDADYTARMTARRDITSMGLKIQNFIKKYEKDSDAERKKHILEIQKELAEMAEDDDDAYDRSYDDRPWVEGDEIVTDTFTIVGKIVESEFNVDSKYGKLKVALEDVAYGDKPVGKKAELNKSLTVAGSDMAGARYKTSGIRVNRGDVITFRASGRIVMSPWGSEQSSSPDGGTNFGFFQSGIEAGSLVGRIGSGKVFKVGSRSRHVCKSSGVLKLGVGMNPDYTNGYNYPGEYKVKIKVSPK